MFDAMPGFEATNRFCAGALAGMAEVVGL